MIPSKLPPPNRPALRPRRSAEAGIGRPGGFFVVAFTAAIVFAIGHRLLTRHAGQEPAPVPAPAPVGADAGAPSRPDGARASSDAAADGRRDGPIDAAEELDATAHPDLGRTGTEEADDVARPVAPTRKAAEGDQEERPADKDLAREAWRRNRPDISTDGTKASILIPIKGSIAGATFRVTNRPHRVIVTLPKAASLITMRLYRVNRDGFGLLWITQAEKDADPQDGTSLKIGLGDPGDPLVEIKDDFVRVSMRRPAPGSPAPERAPAPKGSPERAPAAERANAPEHAPAPEHLPVPAAEHPSAAKAPPAAEHPSAAKAPPAAEHPSAAKAPPAAEHPPLPKAPPVTDHPATAPEPAPASKPAPAPKTAPHPDAD